MINFMNKLKEEIMLEYVFGIKFYDNTIVVKLGDLDELYVEYNVETEEFAPYEFPEGEPRLYLADMEAMVKVRDIIWECREEIKEYLKMN